MRSSRLIAPRAPSVNWREPFFMASSGLVRTPSRPHPNLSSRGELYPGRDMLTEPTDIDLMLRARDGEAAAFHELVRRYRAPLRRFFAALLADRSQADDYAQETFLRLWLARERYVPTGKFSTYLFQIGRHYWLNQRKKQR